MRYAILILLAAAAGCSRAPRMVTEVVVQERTALPAAPGDAAWDNAPVHLAKMVLQDQVEPRLLNPSTAEVAVRALTNGSEIAVRLEWADTTKSDMPGPARMVDACAIQIPGKLEKDPPQPQMGEDGKTVQVTYWRSDWQASLDGRGDTIRDLYPNASIDHYPFLAKPLEQGSDAAKEMARRYAPADAAGNRRGGARTASVEDLIAHGPGTLAPGPSLGSQGKGTHQNGKWTVVIRRKLPDGLGLNQRTNVAFAVWQGSQQESGARKMRTGWIPLVRRGEK